MLSVPFSPSRATIPLTHDIPRSVQDAASVLLRTCLDAAHRDKAVAHSLRAVATFLQVELAGGQEGRPASSATTTNREEGGAHTVLTPPGRPRDDSARDQGQGGTDEKGRSDSRIAEPLAVVVTRARWKASACRIALQRRENHQAPEADRAALESQAASREKSLRSRLGEHPDTSAWMLDFPFGKRVTESGAFDVDADTAKKLDHIAECYETVATGAEIAMDLDEAGAFRGGPPPPFLYLLAEAQSALLHSLHEAPTRIDSDQRDVFLWLKDQTTRYRIYVDRHMRLDDPADIKGSTGLQERMRRAAREALQDRNVRRERGQLLSKVRYHIGKIVGDNAPLHSEVESLRAALVRWSAAGNAATERGLVDALKPLGPHASSLADTDTKDELYELLAESGLTVASGESTDGTRDHVVTPAGSGGIGSAASENGSPGSAQHDPERAQQLLAEVRQLLADKMVTLCCEPDSDADMRELEASLAPRELVRVELEVAGEEEERWSRLHDVLNSSDTDLVLLGVRLPAAEYQRFKEACLERQKPFVRLPGSFSAAAIAHQISRQVGWRLRGQPKES